MLFFQTDLHISGDLEITLAYELPQTLKVTVHKATGLTNRYEDGAPNPFVKLQIPGVQFVHQTVVSNTKYGFSKWQ